MWIKKLNSYIANPSHPNFFFHLKIILNHKTKKISKKLVKWLSTIWLFMVIIFKNYSFLAVNFNCNPFTCWLCLSISCLNNSSMFTVWALVSKLPSLEVTNVQNEPLLSPNLNKYVYTVVIPVGFLSINLFKTKL